MTPRFWELVGRAAGWYRSRQAGGRASVVALIAANLIPIAGVLFFGWSLTTILLLFWLENGIIGLWNIPRIVLARAPVSPTSGTIESVVGTGLTAIAVVPFFVFHYGLFWVVHGIFVVMLVPFVAATGEAAGLRSVPVQALVIGGLALFVSHGISFFENYIGRRQYLAITPSRQMMSVYGRVGVLHVSIIFGALVTASLGSPIGFLLVLLVAKTIVDLRLHLREQLTRSDVASQRPAIVS